MPSVTWTLVDTIEWSLHGVGLLTLVAVLFFLRSRPAGVVLIESRTSHADEPELAGLAFVTLCWLIGSISLRPLLGLRDDVAPAIGSNDWQRLHTSDAMLRVALSLLMLRMLFVPARLTESFNDAGPAEQLPAGANPIATPGFREARRLSWVAVLGLSMAVALILLPICYPLLALTNWLWDQIFPSADRPVHSTLEAIRLAIGDRRVLTLIVAGAVLIAPLAEELFFRGMLLGALRKALQSDWPAILLSSAAFGLVHIPQPPTVLPLAVMGVVLAIVRIRFRSLAVCVIAHALFNLRTIVLALLDPERIALG